MGPDWLDDHLREAFIDFHNGEVCRNLTEKFDPEKYVDTLIRSEANRFVAFAKCNQGFSYYPTKIGRPHPHLRCDMFGQLVKECQKRGLPVMAYYNTTRDLAGYFEFPDWRQKVRDGSDFQDCPAHLKHLCINSPYVTQRLWPVVDEIMAGYPSIRGFFFDATLFMPGTCFCRHCLAKMKSEGIDPDDEAQTLEFRIRSIRDFIDATTERVQAKMPDAAVYYNTPDFIGKAGLQRGQLFLVIESMPAAWGYDKAPLYARHYKKKGYHTEFMVGRFHKMWGDFGGIKAPAAQKYEAGLAASLGMSLSIGDQANPDGTLDEAAYEVERVGFEYFQEREPWVKGAESVPYVALLCRRYEDPWEARQSDRHNYGLSTALIQENFIFDVVDIDDDLSDYRAVVVEDLPADREQARKLQDYVKGGGNLITLGGTIFTGDGRAIAEETLGVKYAGIAPYSVSYFRVSDSRLADGIPRTDWITYGPATHLAPAGAKSLAELVYPYIEPDPPHRVVSHCQSPPGDVAPFPAVTINEFGKGRAVSVACALGRLYHEHSYPPLRILIRNLLNFVIPSSQRLLEAKMPLSTDITLTRQKGRLIVHLLNFHANRRTSNIEVIEEIPPVLGGELTVLVEKAPKRVYLAPQKEDLAWKRDGGHIVIQVPRFDIHAMVVIGEK